MPPGILLYYNLYVRLSEIMHLSAFKFPLFYPCRYTGVVILEHDVIRLNTVKVWNGN
jgi:hypothetical protein